MAWNDFIGPAAGVVGIVLGGLIAKRKPKVDAHTAVITDATAFANSVMLRQTAQEARLDSALRRIDELESKELRRDELARRHIRWDWQLMRQLHDQGIEVSDPPPLFVFDDDNEQPRPA